DVQIEVRDTGIGIPRDFQPQLFKRFSQPRTSTRQSPGGLGLGLAIVKHLIEAHGGSVRLISDGEGHGTTATVRLPLVAAQLRVAEPPPAPYTPASLHGVRVLLVEDNADSREVAALVMGGYGAEVTAVESVDEAMASLHERLPDAIVADLSMPERDGYDLVRTVRASEDSRIRSLPVIALSALASAEDRGRAMEAGFDLHLAKPVEPQALVEAVARLIMRP